MKLMNKTINDFTVKDGIKLYIGFGISVGVLRALLKTLESYMTDATKKKFADNLSNRITEWVFKNPK